MPFSTLAVRDVSFAPASQGLGKARWLGFPSGRNQGRKHLKKTTKTETQRWFNPVSGRFCGTGIDVITFGFRGVLLVFGSDKAPDQTVIVENTNKALRVIFKVTRISTDHASVAKAGLRRSDMICCASGVWPSV